MKKRTVFTDGAPRKEFALSEDELNFLLIAKQY